MVFSYQEGGQDDRATLARAGGVLVALSRKERDLFFPDGVEGGLFQSDWIDTEGLSEGAWREVWVAQQPAILVTSWSTPPLSESLLRKELKRLRYVCHTSGSVRNLVPRVFIEQGGLVTNWGTLAAQAVAEHALLLILGGLRRQPEWAPVIAGHRPWQPSPVMTKTLHGKRVGLHGFGNVARSLVSLLGPFLPSISAFSEGVPEAFFLEYGVTPRPDLATLFSECDVVVECEALTPRSRGSVGWRELDQLPAGALFVNVGRGPVVDEAALAKLARSGRVRIALDVFATDPISPDSPFHTVEGALLSPHIAGPTSDQFISCGKLARNNVAAFLAGLPVEGIVTLGIYDRAT